MKKSSSVPAENETDFDMNEGKIVPHAYNPHLPTVEQKLRILRNSNPCINC
jgi:hypothetical protein